MIFNPRIQGLFLLFFLLFSVAQAQPALPQIGAVTKDGINVLSWVNPYTAGIKSIAVQRSNDSTYNFSTIGYIADLQSGTQSFIDGHPLLGVNWYRLQIIFTSDIEWKSNLARLYVDSAAIANRQPLPTNDSLQKLIVKMGNYNPVNDLQSVSYPRSKYVFTNPFTGNINIELPDALKNIYTLKFYDQSGKEVLEVAPVNDTVVILDKRNFQQSGVFKFELFKNNKEFEKGYITVY